MLETEEIDWTPPPKERVSFRMDSHTLAFFKSYGAGWTTRINAVLSDFMKREMENNEN